MWVLKAALFFSGVKRFYLIIFYSSLFFLVACSGSKKYFKVAERLEKQGLVQDAADYYLESLQRKPGNVEARVKLKEVGQKNVSALASEFFREYNSQLTETSLETYERMKTFTDRCKALGVQLDYPSAYADDYQKGVDSYLAKYYARAYAQVNQKNFSDALQSIRNVKKYNNEYKNISRLELIASCEPLYQGAVNALESRNYGLALNQLNMIMAKTDTYKDSKTLQALAIAQQNKSVILFQPSPANSETDRQLQQSVYETINQLALQELKQLTLINNTPFQNSAAAFNWNNNTNVDLVQAIRKASGADYFYVFDIANRKEFNSGLAKTPLRGYEEVVKKVNDTTTVTEYKAFDYNTVKANRSYSFDYRYKIINSANNQIIASQTHLIKANDAIEYNEFQRRFTGNIKNIFPYNPQTVAPAQRFSALGFRNGFSARSELKSFDVLREDAIKQVAGYFRTSSTTMKR